MAGRRRDRRHRRRRPRTLARAQAVSRFRLALVGRVAGRRLTGRVADRRTAVRFEEFVEGCWPALGRRRPRRRRGRRRHPPPRRRCQPARETDQYVQLDIPRSFSRCATPPASSPTSGAWSAAARPPFDVSMPRRHRNRTTRSSVSASTRSTAASRPPAPRPASRAAGARTAGASGWPSSSPPVGRPRMPFSARAAGSTRQWSSATPPTWPPATARSAGICAPRGGPDSHAHHRTDTHVLPPAATAGEKERRGPHSPRSCLGARRAIGATMAAQIAAGGACDRRWHAVGILAFGSAPGGSKCLTTTSCISPVIRRCWC